MTQEERVLAQEEQVTAAWAKQHEDDENDTELMQRKRKKKEGRQRSKKVVGNPSIVTKVPVCYKAEPETLPPDLPSSYSRRQRYQVGTAAVAPPPPRTNQ